MFKAVLFDFGGVITTSPFEAMEAYEDKHDLPAGFLRRVNATNPHENAWARLERSEVSVEEFSELFAEESAMLGHRVPGAEVLTCFLSSRVRPEMLEAIRRCSMRLKTGLLTNNFVTIEGRPVTDSRELGTVLEHFDVIIESSQVGVRKPDPRFYELACARLEIRPSEAVFLDDLGVNLKPARAMGMKTIKVSDPCAAIRELEKAVDFPLR